MIVRAILLLAVSIWCLQPQTVLSETVKAVASPGREQFQNYWYPHGAEISRYRLEQARYGDIHSGDAVLIFVTESMDPKLQSFLKKNFLIVYKAGKTTTAACAAWVPKPSPPAPGVRIRS